MADGDPWTAANVGSIMLADPRFNVRPGQTHTEWGSRLISFAMLPRDDPFRRMVERNTSPDT